MEEPQDSTNNTLKDDTVSIYNKAAQENNVDHTLNQNIKHAVTVNVRYSMDTTPNNASLNVNQNESQEQRALSTVQVDPLEASPIENNMDFNYSHITAFNNSRGGWLSDTARCASNPRMVGDILKRAADSTRLVQTDRITKRMSKDSGSARNDLTIREITPADQDCVCELLYDNFRSLTGQAMLYWIIQHSYDLCIIIAINFILMPPKKVGVFSFLLFLYLFIRARFEIENHIMYNCPDLKNIYNSYKINEKYNFWITEAHSETSKGGSNENLNSSRSPSPSKAECDNEESDSSEKEDYVEDEKPNVLGCVGIAPYRGSNEIAQMVRLVVKRGCRRMRVGSRLLMQVEMYAKQVGFKEIRIYTNNLNTDYLKFVKQNGYELFQIVRRGLMRGDLLIWSKYIDADNAPAISSKLSFASATFIGVPRNASAKDITSAYRKLAKVMHPDIAPEKEKEFLKVTEAYDVLRDPEKRAKYDRSGRDTMDGGYYSSDSGYGSSGFEFFQDVFSNFGSFQFPFGKGGYQDQYTESYKATEVNAFKGNFEDYTNVIGNTKCVTLFYLHHPQCSTCFKFKSTFENIVKKYKTIDIVSVNCQRYNRICKHEKIKSYPTFIAYKWPLHERFVFQEKLTERLVDSWLYNTVVGIQLPVFTNFNQVENFVINSTVLPLIAVVNNPKSIILTSLAMVLKGKASIAVVHADSTTIVSRLSPQTVPSILSVLNVTDIVGDWHSFKRFDFDDMLLKLRLDASKFKMTKGGTKGMYKKLTNKLIEAGECGPKDGQYCFIALVKEYDGKLDAILKGLASKYRNEPVKIRYYNITDKVPFGIYMKRNIMLVAYRPKKSKYKILEGVLSSQNIDDFINGVLEGSVKLDTDAGFFDFRQGEL